jgi:hypothetical protein
MTLAPVSSDLPNVFTPATRHDTDSWVTVVGDVVRLAQQIAGTEFVPKGIRDSIPATAAAMLYGREVGLPPMTALTQIHVIEGRPGLSAEAMRALVLAAGHDLAFEDMTGASCTVKGRRSGSATWTSLTWTIDMGRAAGLLHKDNWKRYPRSMLIARATADLCRLLFPDVIHGFRAIEELDDLDETALAPAGALPASGKTTTVGRKGARKTAPKTAADAGTPSPAPAVSDLPPLPGEGDAEAGGGGQTPSPAEADHDNHDDRRPPVAPPPVETPTLPPRGEDGEVDEADPGDRRAGRPQLRMLFAQFRRLGLDDAQHGDREERLALVAAIVGHDVDSTADLTQDEAQRVIVTISSVRNADALRALLARIEAGQDEPLGFQVEDPPRTDPPPPSESE